MYGILARAQAKDKSGLTNYEGSGISLSQNRRRLHVKSMIIQKPTYAMLSILIYTKPNRTDDYIIEVIPSTVTRSFFRISYRCQTTIEIKSNRMNIGREEKAQ